MSEVVDPLKYRSFGVKQPVDEKKQKWMEKDENKYKRFYPTNKQGNVDEWAAMIKYFLFPYSLDNKLKCMNCSSNNRK